MGICIANTELNSTIEIIQINKKKKVNEAIKMFESNIKNDRIKECIIETSPSFAKLNLHSDI